MSETTQVASNRDLYLADNILEVPPGRIRPGFLSGVIEPKNLPKLSPLERAFLMTHYVASGGDRVIPLEFLYMNGMDPRDYPDMADFTNFPEKSDSIEGGQERAAIILIQCLISVRRRIRELEAKLPEVTREKGLRILPNDRAGIEMTLGTIRKIEQWLLETIPTIDCSTVGQLKAMKSSEEAVSDRIRLRVTSVVDEFFAKTT